MKNLMLILFIPFFCFTQNLPEHYHFSENQQKLIRGGAELNGFYNESEIKTIYLYFDL